MQQIKVKGQAVQELGRKQTDRRTDTTTESIFPGNVFGKDLKRCLIDPIRLARVPFSHIASSESVLLDTWWRCSSYSASSWGSRSAEFYHITLKTTRFSFHLDIRSLQNTNRKSLASLLAASSRCFDERRVRNRFYYLLASATRLLSAFGSCSPSNEANSVIFSARLTDLDHHSVT